MANSNALADYLRSGGTLDYVKNELHVDIKPHPRYPNLLHFSYNMIESPMDNPIVLDCRGTILDSTDNWAIVCYGFRRFLNLGEPNAATLDWSKAKYYEKVDGSLIQLYVYDNVWHVATTGTPDAGGEVNGYGISFADKFREVFKQYYPKDCIHDVVGPWDPGNTYMFELVGPMNQVVVTYSDGLKFLGMRNRNGHEFFEMFPYFNKIPRPKTFDFKSLEEAVNHFSLVEGHEMEGFVAVDPHFNRVKIKHPGYVHLHRIRDGLSRPGIMELIQKGDSEEVVAYFPNLKPIHDEMKAWYTKTINALEWAYSNLKPPTDPLERKAYAAKVLDLKIPFKHTLFETLKGKSVKACMSEIHLKYLMEAFDERVKS